MARVAPITLVYGPNSAGKSSLVKSLLLLKQSTLESRSGGLRFDGPYVDLGGSKAVVHRHSVNRRIGVEVGLGRVEHDERRWTVALKFSMGVEKASDDRISISVEAEEFTGTLEFRRSNSTPAMFRLADANAARAYESLTKSLLRRESSLFELEALSPQSVGFEPRSLLPGRAAAVFSTSRSAVSTPVAMRDLADRELAWSAFADRICEDFEHQMRGVSYIGPLRRPWSRVEVIHPDGQIEGVGSAGEWAVNLLHRRPDLLSRVNRSLSLLEFGYSLEVKTLGDDADSSVADIVPTYLVPMLRHDQSGVAISPADAGFGLSQLLPFLVELELRKQSIICIEQPELHLHPRLQANVGAVLRKAVEGGNRNRFIIETHSEHLLLRLQRLIRQGLLDANSVLVVYVDNQLFDEESDRFYQSISSTMLTLRLSASGDLLDPWPGGFFDERWEELSARNGSTDHVR